ncbi:choice-of-anchor L domain-containing protein [Cylindrospermopsis raciborskii]|uniref:choice-of-anchor L domain-containing protein n=1 Tax=Cylindrospermopsis raciborskii TaxID=77022 RepID=UPI0015A61006|nr:choice-of-anchor L domain-containing protein [Cylindrospermopsis raciborskii]
MADALDLASAILGSGVAITDANFTGNEQSAAVFSAADPSTGVGITSGIVLSTGKVADIYGPNDSDTTSTDFFRAGDTDLNVLVTPSDTKDAAVLEFDFVPTNSFLTFNYVFASEEYNEWVSTQFNDVFGFFVTDSLGVTTNIAVIPGTTTPIATNNVNSSTNPAYYLNNDTSDFGLSTTPYNTEFDGFTTVLTAAIQVIPDKKYHFKLAIADNSDGIYDSAVFITKGSFASLPLVPVTDSFLVSSYSSTPLDVLANDLVLEGKQPFIKAFDSSSINGGTVYLNDNQTPDNLLDDNLLYTPQSGFSGVDSFNYTLGDGSGNAVTGTVYIQVNMVGGVSTLSVGDVSVVENGSYEVWIPVMLTGIADQTFTVDYSLSPDTATENQDYTPVTGTLTFNPGDSIQYIVVPLQDDDSVEGNETFFVNLSNVSGGAVLGQTTGTVTITENEKYTFTYFYGNGDSYSGYGFAQLGTHGVGKLPYNYDNETGTQKGYYFIDSVEDSETGTDGYVYITSYTDADTGFGETTNIWYGGGYSGLGSEYGYAYNSDGNTFDPYFNSYYEADIIGQEYTFTYFYGNGDNYSGYGFAPLGTYTVGQLPDYYDNETGTQKGYYVINSVEDGATGTNGYVYITSYTDADTGFGETTNIWYGGGYSGLGSEYGYAYNSDGNTFDPYFNSYYEADIIGQEYTFTYFYGNGDNYSGYGFAPLGTYTVGQLPDYYDNETGTQKGYYVINSVEDGATNTKDYVQVTSYTDADTGFGETTSIYSGSGYYGLGSEGGQAFNANPWTGDTYFSRYYEADLPAALQVQVNLLADDGGKPGEVLADNRVGLNHSFFVQIQAGDFRPNAAGVVGLNLDFAWNGSILESINFNPSLDITSNFPYQKGGTLASDGLIDDLSGGSLPEFGTGKAIGVNQLETFALLHFSTQNYGNWWGNYFTTTVNDVSLADDNPYYSLNVETDQPVYVVTPYAKYNFTYTYANGDSYTGYVYAVEGTYTEGQIIAGTTNETGFAGSYTIGSTVETTLDVWYNNRVYVTSYTDADTGFGETTNISKYWWGGNGDYGLGSENGYAYDSNGLSSDPFFGADGSGIHKEADILNQKYTFTYTYGNGDSYSGYGYALAGTYTEGQIVGYYPNETESSGTPGHYTINSVEAGTTSSSVNNHVYITSYTDNDTFYGETTNVWKHWWGGNGDSGLGSEYGYAYDSNGSAWDGGYFNKYYEADLVKATLSISDNSGNASDSSIKFTTQFPKRINYTESDFVRPNFADTTKYIEIANNGTGILQVVSLQVSDDVLGVTTNFEDLISSEVDYLLINPGASQQIKLTYDPSVAGENFSVANGLLLVTNDPYNPQHAIALQGKSTYDADINYDGKVSFGDLGPLNNAYKNFKEGIYDSTADINGDGDVGLGDLGLLTAQWGSVL